MDSRKTNAPQHETRNLDAFSQEAPIDDRGAEQHPTSETAEQHPTSETTGALKIESTDAANWLEMFDSEGDQVELNGSVTRVDPANGIAIQPSWRATVSRAAVMKLIERFEWPQVDRWRSHVGVIATVSAFGLVAGMVFSRVDFSIVRDDPAARRTTAPAVPVVPSHDEVAPSQAPVQIADESARGPSAVSAPKASVTARSPRRVQQSPRPPARNVLATKGVTRPSAPPARPAVASRASGIGTIANTPPANTPPAATPSRDSGLSPGTEAEATRQPAPSPAPLVAAIVSTPVTPASPTPPITTATASAAATVPATVTDTRAVTLALNRYERAFSAMDVAGARAVWPSVDVKALTKAFEQLEEQRFDLDKCDITVAGALAEANCSGDARYVRKVGSRAMRVEPRRWHFKLRQANEEWIIDAVNSR